MVPMPSVPYRASSFRLMNRQPKLVSCISASRPKGLLTLLMTQGPRVMCSTSGNHESASPMWRPRGMDGGRHAGRTEPVDGLARHRMGKPARSKAIRATLRLSSPA